MCIKNKSVMSWIQVPSSLSSILRSDQMFMHLLLVYSFHHPLFITVSNESNQQDRLNRIQAVVSCNLISSGGQVIRAGIFGPRSHASAVYSYDRTCHCAGTSFFVPFLFSSFGMVKIGSRKHPIVY